MARNAKFIRRTLGSAFLAGSILLLIAGETFLKGRLDGLPFLIYWSACFLFTFLTIVIAFLDLAAVRRETREEHRVLIEGTIQEIEEAKKRKARKPSGGGRQK